jgi:hypothetical protein
MTLAETVLRKLAEWRPAGSGRHVVAVPDAGSGWAVSVTADRCDALGCLVWELDVRRTGLGSSGAAALEARAKRVAQRVTGLLETLKVVEVDAERNEALLRSTEPSPRGDRVAYYEALLQGTGRAVVRRFEAPREPGDRREQVAFALTHEVLAKLAADLAADE